MGLPKDFNPFKDLVIKPETLEAFKGISIDISIPLFDFKPSQVKIPPVQWEESDAKVRAIKETILKNSGIWYTEDATDFRRYGGPMSMFCQAFYSNPAKDEQTGLAMLAPALVTQVEMVAVLNVDNNRFGLTPGQPLSAARRLSLWFHEFGHATGLASRLNRPVINDVNAHHNRRESAIEELIAEKCARIGMNHFGMAGDETNAFHDSYLKTHFGMLPVEEHEFINAFTDREAQRAFDFILNNWLVGLELPQEEAA